MSRERRQKYFNREESIALYEEVTSIMLIDKFDNHKFRTIAFKHFERSKFHRTNLGAVFKCSDSYICRWRSRNSISVRIFHYARRIEGSAEKSQLFRQKVRNAINRYGLDFVLNMDETNWSVVPTSRKTWAIKGADEVKVQKDKVPPEKLNFTSIATITASYRKFKLVSIAKGKSNRCH